MKASTCGEQWYAGRFSSAHNRSNSNFLHGRRCEVLGTREDPIVLEGGTETVRLSSGSKPSLFDYVPAHSGVDKITGYGSVAWFMDPPPKDVTILLLVDDVNPDQPKARHNPHLRDPDIPTSNR